MVVGAPGAMVLGMLGSDILPKDGQMRKGCLLPQHTSSDSWEGNNLTG